MSLPILAICALLCVLLTPVVMRMAFRMGAVDFPGGRRVHRHVVARMGGLALIPVFALGVLTWGLLEGQLSNRLLTGLMGVVLALALGLVDDLRNVGARKKLFFQLSLAGVLFASGTQLRTLYFAPGIEVHLGVFSLPLTVLFLSSVMNAFNLIDGIDALASGFAAIVLSLFAVLAWVLGAPDLAFFSALAAVCSASFLIYNWSPAKIFLGDSGSMALGFVLGFISVHLLALEGPSGGVLSRLPAYVPVLMLLFPLLDLFVAVLRRFIQVKDQVEVFRPSQDMFKALLKHIMSADGGHIHHKLLQRGQSHRQVATFAYGLTLVSSAVGGVALVLPHALSMLLLVFFGYIVIQFVGSLGYEEFLPKEVRRVRHESTWRRAVGMDRA